MNAQHCKTTGKTAAGRILLRGGLGLLVTMIVFSPATHAEFRTEVKAEAGLGYDSNIYRSPSSSYMDNSLATPVLVSPKVESGLFLPLTLDGAAEYNLSAEQYLYADYKFDGMRYLDSQYSNADQHESTLTLGLRHFMNPGSRFEYFDIGFEISDQKQLYLDRDLGTNKSSSGGIDVSDRYTYSSLGVLMTYKQEKGKLDYRFDAKLIDKDYVDAVFISQMDHRFVELSANVDYKQSSKRSVYADYAYQTYDYVERPSRDAQGTLSAANPALQYRIQSVALGVKQKFSKKLKVDAEYTYSLRDDLYVGYHDYVKHKVKVSGRYAYNKTTDIKAGALTWVRDYPNALAFDEPGQKQKAYDGTQLWFGLKQEFKRNMDWGVDFKYTDENSTDLRYEYTRMQLVGSVSAKW